MRKINRIIILLLFVAYSSPSLSEESHRDERSEKNKAIIDVHDGGKKFKLSQKSIKTLKIESTSIESLKKNKFQVPSSSLLRFGGDVGVYLLRDGWFELIEIELIEESKKSLVISSEKIKEKDQVVTAGVPLLRLAHLEASGAGGEGHGH